jgi:hypothetical protein
VREAKLEICLSGSKKLSFYEVFDDCGPMMGIDDFVSLSKQRLSLVGATALPMK